MNIIDAIKSGRPFRRKEYADKMDYICLPKEGFNTLNLAIGDIVADDWETEDPKVEITESEFWNAACIQLAATTAAQGITFVSPSGREREIMMNQLQTVLLKQMAEQLFGKKDAPLKGAGEK